MFTLIDLLKERFLANMDRHPGMRWEKVEARINEECLRSLTMMEESGGQPDVIGYDEEGRIIYCDCCPETPEGRRSLCYDDEALRKRAKNPPADSAMHQAQQMGVKLLSEQLYRRLQQLGEFDTRTSSWIVTPEEIRSLGGALFCERRYGKVFTFHNGADSYYSVRGWRGCLFL